MSYPALANAASDRLYVEGLVSPSNVAAVAGFSTPFVSVFDVRDPSHPLRLSGVGVQENGSTYTVHWNESVTDPAYALSTDGALRAPGAIESMDRTGRPQRWADPELAYDYVAIVGGEHSYAGTTALGSQLAAALQPLVAHRTAEGFQVAQVPVQDIYDEWSYGRIDPMAIRSFLSYAYHNWATPPGYVLLVGDGHYDYNKVTTQPLPMLVPPYLADVDPWWGEVPTDNLYVSVDSAGDYLPDMAVGRLPVNTVVDVTAMVDKILAYESVALNPSGAWQQRAIYVADDCDDSGGDFHDLSDQGRLQWLPAAYTSQKIYYDNPSIAQVCPDGTHSDPTAARTAVRQAFSNGSFYLQWFGHGAQSRWGNATTMIAVNDFFQQLVGPTNQLPLSTANACLTGYFVWNSSYASRQSLAELMVTTPQRGSIADLSPSGLHVGSALLTLQKGMHKKLFEERIERAGDVVDAVKFYFFANSASYLDVIDTMIFFGDPALKLRYPTGDLAGSGSPGSGSTLEVNPTQANLGDNLLYTLTIKNSGLFVASEPQVVVDYPEDLATVVTGTVSVGGADNGETLTWTLPDDLPPGGQREVTFELEVNSVRAPANFDLIVSATVSSPTAPSVVLVVTTEIVTPPLSVELEYFIGTADYPNHILLEWQSVSEENTFAFRLRRGTSPDPTAIEWTSPVIDAHPGSTLGYYYSYQDNFNLTPGTTYYYWIEDQDNNGTWIQHLDDPNLNPVVPWGCSVYDVVCNFVIDSQDITAIANHWTCALGSGCYDSHFDVNGDNVINVRDVMLTASRWGCQRLDACYN